MRGTGADRIRGDVDVHGAGECVRHHERRRRQVVHTAVGVDAPLEVAVAREHRGHSETARRHRGRHLGVDRTGVADAGGAAVADDVEAERREVAQWPVVRRTEALRRINEPGLANSEWLGAVARADGETARRLADYAASQGWHAKLVQTTIAGRMWDALEWRFPAAYRDSADDRQEKQHQPELNECANVQACGGLGEFVGNDGGNRVAGSK